jgi:hypothetical protein
MFLLLVVTVFAAGGVFGYGVYRYLDKAGKDDGGNGGYARLPDASGGNSPQAPSPEPRPADTPSPPGNPGPRTDQQPPPPRKEEPPPPVKEERPTPKEETPPLKREEPPATKEEPPRKEEPPPVRKEDPPKREEPPAPPKKEEPAPKKEEPSAPPRKEPTPDERLKPILVALTSKKKEERLQAVEDMGKLAEVARPATRALVEVLMNDPFPAVREAALAALEKIHPDLHRPVVVLLVEADPAKHEAASRDIARLGEEARGAVPVLLGHVKLVPTKMPAVAPELIAADAAALAETAPDDPMVHKALLELTRLSDIQGKGLRGNQPARLAAVQALADLLQKHPEQAKNLIPGLSTATRLMPDAEVRSQATAILGSVAESQAELRPQIATGLTALLKQGEVSAIPSLGKCGREAKDAIPLLKQYKLHQQETVRTLAADALTRIEEALASATAPPRKEEPPPKTDRPAPPPEGAELPRELQPIVSRLRSGPAEDRIKAASELAEMGEKAQPAARALCEAALAPSQKLAQAALRALEKVHPDLHQSVFVLLIDDKANNHKQALEKLSRLREEGKPAVPVLLHQIKRCQDQLLSGQSAWNSRTLVEVTALDLETMCKVAPEDPQAVKTVIDLTSFTLQHQVVLRNGQAGTKPFRQEGTRLLGEIAEGQPELRKQVIPPLVSVLKEAVQETNATPEFQVLAAIQEVDLAGAALLKCGPEAKDALVKEVLPRLKDLQFHKSAEVRKKAEELRGKIEGER